MNTTIEKLLTETFDIADEEYKDNAGIAYHTQVFSDNARAWLILLAIRDFHNGHCALGEPFTREDLDRQIDVAFNARLTDIAAEMYG